MSKFCPPQFVRQRKFCAHTFNNEISERRA